MTEQAKKIPAEASELPPIEGAALVEELVCLKTFPSRMEAELAQGLLESLGIPSMVSADDCGGQRPHMLFGSGGAQLFVPKSQAEKAAEALRGAGEN